MLLTEALDSSDQMIAIVGMDGVFPDAENVHAFWENVLAGTESGVSFDPAALEQAGVPAALIKAPNFVTRRPMLKQADQFDAGFFDFSDIEAQALDPQLRFLLQSGYRALEEAASADAQTRLRVGCFAGVRHSRYLDDHLMPSAQHCAALGADYMQMINRKDSAATLMAYKLGLGGPAVSVNTACSTSLLAVHLACNSLLSYECDAALAGGAAIPSFGPDGNLYVPGGFLSKDGRCRPFSDDAGGTIDGAGVAVVALKRYADALRDGNIIHAVILGSAINNDGDDKVGYTAPSVNGQMRVIGDALAVAGVAADSIGYLETHGTGTRLGDPIEFRAVTLAYRQHTARTNYCALGSLKANIGHLGAAAGIAGLIKAALAVREGQVPPLVNFVRPNPEIALSTSPFFVPLQASPWPAGATPRRAAVSSFGIGGTNAHMIVQQAPARAAAPEPAPAGSRLCVLSAKSPLALAATASAIAAQLLSQPDERFADLAGTLARQRAHLPWRAGIVADSAHALAHQLQNLASPQRRAGSAPRVAFLFPGQGSQHRGMTLALRRWPGFAAPFDQVVAMFRQHAGLDLGALLEAPDETALTATDIAQPALFATSYALCAAWRSLGVEPVALLGHSIGELAAACVAGVFSLEDAVALVSARAQLMQRAPEGAMLAVLLSERALMPLLPHGVELAAINGPAACVVSGSHASIDVLQAHLAARGITARRLKTSHGFHSAAMDDAARQFGAVVRSVTLAPPAIPVVSNVTGLLLTDAEAQSPDYWARQLRQPVQFARGLQCLAELHVDCLLEVGGGTVLSTLARAVLPSMPAIASQPAVMQAGQDGAGETAFLRAAGALWERGVALDLVACQGPAPSFASVSLPGYQFEPQHHWVEAGRRSAAPEAPAPAGSVLRAQLKPWFAAPPSGLVRIDTHGVPAGLGESLAAAGHTLAGPDHADLTVVHADNPVDAALLTASAGARVVANFNHPDNRQALHALLSAGRVNASVVLLEGQAFASSAGALAGAPAAASLGQVTGLSAAMESALRAELPPGAVPLNLLLLSGPDDPLASLPHGSAWLVLDPPDLPDAQRAQRMHAVRQRLTSAGACAGWLILRRPAARIGSSELASMVRACAHEAATYLDAVSVNHLDPIENNQESADMAVDEQSNAAATAGSNDVHGTIHAIWTQVLGREQIGMDENFFDLGGNSLWALQIVSRVNQAFGCEIELSQLLGAATVNDLAALVEQKLFSQIDDSEFRQLLSECADLSEEELQLLLQA